MSEQQQKLVVIVTNGFNDERSSVAWSVANRGVGMGFEVTMFLVSSGVDWVCKGAATVARPNPLDPPIKDMIQTVLDSGGQILVCPPCAGVRGYAAADLIDSVTLAGSASMPGQVRYCVPMHVQDDTRAFFTAGVEANMNALYSVALRLTRNSADAQALVAEAVTRAWAGIGTLTDRSLFRAWVFRILRNCFISDRRKRAVRPVEASYHAPCDDEGEAEVASLLVEEPDEFLDWWANPEHRVSSDVLGEQIMTAIESLPDAFQAAILLVNVDGLTYDEAAEVLGVPPGTVRSRMKRGRTLLQKAL